MACMHGLECPLKAFRMAGNKDQVHVIGHEAIGEDLDPVSPGIGTKKGEVEMPVRVIVEYRLAAIATLGYVERDVGDHLAGESRHEEGRWTGRVQ